MVENIKCFILITTGYAPRGRKWHFKCLFFLFKYLRYLSMLRISLRIFIFFSIFCDFSWEGGGTLPQNSYKPSQDLWEATLVSFQRLARSFGTHWHRQTHSLLLYFKGCQSVACRGFSQGGGRWANRTQKFWQTPWSRGVSLSTPLNFTRGIDTTLLCYEYFMLFKLT